MQLRAISQKQNSTTATVARSVLREIAPCVRALIDYEARELKKELAIKRFSFECRKTKTKVLL